MNIESIAQLLSRARAYLEDQKKEKLSAELIEPHVSSELPPLPTFATAQEKWRKNRDERGFVKESVEKFKLRLAGVENTDDVMALAEYLERALVDEEHHYIHVKASKKDREIEKYRRKRYEIHNIHDSYRKGEVQFGVQKEKPYRVSLEEKKKLVDLLGKANDPVAMIERLRRVGFKIEAHTMYHQFDALRDFVTSPEIDEVLKKFEQADLKSEHLYFGYPSDGIGGYYSAHHIKEYALDPRKREKLTDENLQKTAQLKRMGFSISFDHLDGAINVVSDDDMLTLLNFMGQKRKALRGYHWQEWGDAMLLRDADLVGEFAKIIHMSPLACPRAFIRMAGEILLQLFCRRSTKEKN